HNIEEKQLDNMLCCLRKSIRSITVKSKHDQAVHGMFFPNHVTRSLKPFICHFELNNCSNRSKSFFSSKSMAILPFSLFLFLLILTFVPSISRKLDSCSKTNGSFLITCFTFGFGSFKEITSCSACLTFKCSSTIF